MKMVFATLALISVTSCATQETNLNLSVDNSGHTCVIKFNDELIQTQLFTPCRFLESDGGIQERHYPWARMVVHILIGQVDPKTDCGTERQWFIWGDKSFVPNHVVKSGMCVEYGADEIVYRDAFHYFPGGKELMDTFPAGPYDG